jgi:hypothetical protein
MDEPTINTVVTMTSWVGRIRKVGLAIHTFMQSQTVKPDIFYLVLSHKEFADVSALPDDLKRICKIYNVQLLWCNENDYCFKRWYVFPKHYNDLVISIDDDIIFHPKLIETAQTHKHETNHIYNIFKDLTFTYKFKPNDTKDFSLPFNASILYNMIGCSVICPKSFPLDVMTVKNLHIRRILCPYCDEQWLKPFTIMNDTLIGFLPFDSHDAIIDTVMQRNSTWKKMCPVYDGFQVRNYQLFINLIAYPDHLRKWLGIYPSYNYEFFFKKGISKCLQITRSNA